MNNASKTKIRKEVCIMELKYVIPNMEETFGNLEYAGEGKFDERRINGRRTSLGRSYCLYSDTRRAGGMERVPPSEAGEKMFGHEDSLHLVIAGISAERYKIGYRGFTNYKLHADD